MTESSLPRWSFHRKGGEKMAKYCVGIDLGTTNTVCAVWTHGEERPRVLRLWQPVSDFTTDCFRRLALLPSAVAVLEEGVFVGAAARMAARIGGVCMVFTSTKRHMGRHWMRYARDEIWTPELVAACVLKAVRQELQTMFPEEAETVVITVPASFGTEARRATLRAARLAGFPPSSLRLFDEPTAALLSEIQSEGSAGLDTGSSGRASLPCEPGNG